MTGDENQSPEDRARNAALAHLQRLRVVQLIPAAAHRVRRPPDRMRDDAHPARPQLAGLGAEPDPALTLGQVRPDSVVAAG